MVQRGGVEGEVAVEGVVEEVAVVVEEVAVAV